MVGVFSACMSIQVVPPSIDTCHSTVGAGVPLAAAVKVTDSCSLTDWFARLGRHHRSHGGVSTVRVAAFGCR